MRRNTPSHQGMRRREPSWLKDVQLKIVLAGIDLQIPDESEDVERGAEGRHGCDEGIQSTASGERSAGTVLSGSGAGEVWYETRSRG